MKNNLTQQQLQKYLFYDPLTGVFTTRRPTPQRPYGSIVGGADKSGYIQLYLLGYKYLAHRLAWLYVYGVWPTEFLDHINLDKADNRIANLREASKAQNQHNRGLTAANKSGIKGISWDKRSKRWRCRLVHKGKEYSGLFYELEDAKLAYAAKVKMFHGDFARVPGEV